MVIIVQMPSPGTMGGAGVGSILKVCGYLIEMKDESDLLSLVSNIIFSFSIQLDS